MPFDLAVPGNHEFDFGPENFIEKMKASKYPWAAINITKADGIAIDGSGRRDGEGDGRAEGRADPGGAGYHARGVQSRADLKFLPTVETGVAAAEKAREDGADLVVGVVQTDMENDRALIASKAFDVILSGDDHSYATAYDGHHGLCRNLDRRAFLSPVDLTVEIGEDDGKRTISWKPDLPLHRHRDRDARPGVAGDGRCICRRRWTRP